MRKLSGALFLFKPYPIAAVQGVYCCCIGRYDVRRGEGHASPPDCVLHRLSWRTVYLASKIPVTTWEPLVAEPYGGFDRRAWNIEPVQRTHYNLVVRTFHSFSPPFLFFLLLPGTVLCMIGSRFRFPAQSQR